MKRNPLVYSSGLFSGAWVFMAWIQPETNFFLFPILIGAALPVSNRLIVGKPTTGNAAFAAGIASMINVAITALLLTLVDRLQGESVLGFVSLFGEAIILGLIGAIAGAVIATLQISR
ncbi:MAG: hypothetical protein HKN93_00485 [Acidimicrobiia bacterium]|nr:hypothetical protein [Acidimicrobiia bacterium]